MVKLPDPRTCRKCGSQGRVVNSRTDPRGYRWRRRECKPCNWRWNTYETTIDPRDVNKDQPIVVEPLRVR